MGLQTFFDLSKPATFRKKSRAPATTDSAPAPAAPAPPSQLTWAWQLAIYLILVLSIFASRFLDPYRAGVLSEFSVDGPYMLFTAIASLLAFPIVYDRAQLTRDRPVLVQIGLIFAAGMGWEKLIATAVGK